MEATAGLPRNLPVPEDPEELKADIVRRGGGLIPGRDDNFIKPEVDAILSGQYGPEDIEVLIKRNPTAAPIFQQTAEMRKQFDIYSKGRPEERYGVGAGPLAGGYVPLEQAQTRVEPAIPAGDIGRLQQSLIGMGPEGARVAASLPRKGSAESLFSKINPKDYTRESVQEFQATGDFGKLVTAKSPTGNETFDRAAKLRGEYVKNAGDFMKVRDSYSRIQASAQDPSAAGDLSMIFNYMKMLDPGSVVRESEFATAQNSAGVPDRIRMQYNRALQGERLAENTRNDFLNRATRLYEKQQEQHEKRKSVYTGLAKRAGTDPRNVVIDIEQAKPKMDKKQALKEKYGLK